ncbi:MAG: cellulase family glycosylhydrolase [Verrucomicrobiota bacterium]
MRKYPVLAVLALCLCALSAFAQGPYYSCSGRNILGPDGQPFQIRGNDLSHWQNTEAYALRLNAVHSRHLGSESSIKTRIREIVGVTNAAKFWNTFQSNFVTQADVADFSAEGFNTIRFSFNYRLVSPQDTPGQYSSEGFAFMDKVVQWCAANDLAVILDMHACPGGQSHDGPADPEWTYWYWSDAITNWLETGVPCLWQSNADYYATTGRTPEFNKQRTADIWREIANRYKDEPAILGYELMNEAWLPADAGVEDLRAALIQITDAIREVDANHIIMVGGDLFGGSLEGLVPPWDSNMVLCFHRYWTPTTQATIQPFLDVAIQHNVPLCVTESGENSNPWLYEFAQLLEANNIGWCMWGYKKVDNIASAFSAYVTPDYQYVIDNFRDLPINATRANKGLMECATNVLTAKCAFDPGWFDALLSPQFNTQPYAFVTHTLPCKINCVNYDVGNQGLAYSDTRYKNPDGLYGAPYNSGWKYRNDGVDVNTTSEAGGFKVSWVDSNERLKFTVNVSQAAKYDIYIRTASPNSTGRLQLYWDGAPLTSVISVPKTGGWDNFRATTVKGFNLTAGQHVLEARFTVGGFDISSIEFKKAR